MERALTTPHPEYRALLMFEKVPAGFITFPCRDGRSLPHVKPGEFVVVDTNDRTPVAGELFVIKFNDKPINHHICMVRYRERVGWSDPTQGSDGWTVGAVVNDAVRRAVDTAPELGAKGGDHRRFMIEANLRTGAWLEGPYRTAGPSFDHLCNCLVGRIIGIYEPRFEEPKRGASR
jgi:hypothetical protein